MRAVGRLSMTTTYRVDTMGVDGKWHCITSGIGMSVHVYMTLQSAKTDAALIAHSENTQVRVMQIDERELEIIVPPNPA